jgi:hypothetical protein
MAYSIEWSGYQVDVDPDNRVAILPDHGREVAMIYMPGLPCPVMIAISGTEHPVWGWNGDKKNPTFSPSIITRLPWGEAGREVVNHVFIRDGHIQYLSDCSHEYAGKTIDLPRLCEWPEDFLLW